MITTFCPIIFRHPCGTIAATSLYVDYRYAKKSKEIDNDETIQSIYGKLTVQLTDRLSILLDHEQNIEKSLRSRPVPVSPIRPAAGPLILNIRMRPMTKNLNLKSTCSGSAEPAIDFVLLVLGT